MRNRPDWRDEGTEPDSRFSMANERTYLAWVRTALATMAGSVGLFKFGPGGELTGLRRGLALALGALALVIAASAYTRWRSTEEAMRHGRPLPHSSVLPLLAVGVVVVAVGVLVLVAVG